MSSICDEDLILYYYRDGLTPDRLEAIEAALKSDAELSARYAALSADLDEAASAFVAEAPAEGFEDRIFEGFEARWKSDRESSGSSSWMSVTNIVSGLKSLLSGTSVPRWSWAAGALAVTLMVGLWIGRVTAPTPEPYFLTPNAGNRVLGAQLTRHLESTERTLLMAAHGRGDPELAAELADALLESHRLYAQAAERAGQGELALFLRELEPVLLQLANADTLGGPNAVREAIIRRDLPFKIRAVTAATRRDLGGSTPEWL